MKDLTRVGRFEIKRANERLYWSGVEDEWRDGVEIEGGTLLIPIACFLPGTVIEIREPK